jgi:hypothetical protein
MLKTYYDRSSIGSVTTTPEGYLRFDAIASRSGIFIYYNADGSTRRAYRAPAEVFKADSMASFTLKPIVNNHEMGVTPKITADNVKQFQIGAIGENVRQDGNYLKLTGTIMDKAGIQAVKDGRRGLSLAYDSEDIDEPGITADGLKYDYRQTNIRGNHLAIVDQGRAGDCARLNMDTADIMENPLALNLTTNLSQGERKMKYNLDGVEVEAPESIVNALVKARTDCATATTALTTANADSAQNKTKLDTVTAERDAAKAELTKIKAVDTEKLVQDGIAARIALVESASLICDAADPKGKTDAEIKGLVIAKVFPELKMDGKSAEYVSAMFDAALTAGDTKQRKEAIASQRKAAVNTNQDSDPNAEKKEANPVQDAWKAPCSMSVKK